jgi:hypothetical protein
MWPLSSWLGPVVQPHRDGIPARHGYTRISSLHKIDLLHTRIKYRRIPTLCTVSPQISLDRCRRIEARQCSPNMPKVPELRTVLSRLVE